MKKLFLPIQLLLILSLSLSLQYKLPNFSETNWDIVLFLSPYGIISNYLSKDSKVMWSFYSDISVGQIEISSYSLSVFSIIYLFMISSVYFLVIRESKKE